MQFAANYREDIQVDHEGIWSPVCIDDQSSIMLTYGEVGDSVTMSPWKTLKTDAYLPFLANVTVLPSLATVTWTCHSRRFHLTSQFKWTHLSLLLCVVTLSSVLGETRIWPFVCRTCFLSRLLLNLLPHVRWYFCIVRQWYYIISGIQGRTDYSRLLIPAVRKTTAVHNTEMASICAAGDVIRLLISYLYQ